VQTLKLEKRGEYQLLCSLFQFQDVLLLRVVSKQTAMVCQRFILPDFFRLNGCKGLAPDKNTSKEDTQQFVG